MYPNFGYLSKFRKWDTHFECLDKKKVGLSPTLQ